MPPRDRVGPTDCGPTRGPTGTGRGDDGGVGRLRTNLGRREIFRFLPGGRGGGTSRERENPCRLMSSAGSCSEKGQPFWLFTVD